MSKKTKLILTVEVTYDLGSQTVGDMRRKLTEAAHLLYDEGLLTGTASDATVESWSARVQEDLRRTL